MQWILCGIDVDCRASLVSIYEITGSLEIDNSLPIKCELEHEEFTEAGEISIPELELLTFSSDIYQ